MDFPHALTIAGSDSGGGAGIQADLKTMAAHKVYGMSAIAAITAQNTTTVSGVQEIAPAMVAAQIDAVFADIRVDAVKIGMLFSAEIIRAVAACLQHWQAPFVVLDPVMISKSGCHLLQPAAVSALKECLLPLATLVTPNIPEAEVMTELSIRTRGDMLTAAASLCASGARAVLLKGGHSTEHADDLLFDGHREVWLTGTRLVLRNTHGTGCTLSSAIAANLAQGCPLEESCRRAKEYVRRAIAAGLEIGQGCGPLHHFVDWY
ncbi:MAG: bifunctional hydroxymethylpyrimidine kinase/phosphomethylpyrimidine kinase [Oligosphaeraceae bacterium]|jgi:hydroxymethylpyrimidine/phosphomethylpyrimidine kinase|nr:bifunctional hydroxymethylpyrimidine kinase/phosphomethylpyrimidine kinase [Oligosphaeraceae bacterium]